MPEVDKADCGCDADEFAVATDETAGLPDAGGVDPRGNKVRHWSGLIAPYALPTGDGRRFAKGALSSRELPLPLKWQRQDGKGHEGSSAVGRIDKINFTDEGVFAEGIIFDPDPELTSLADLKKDADEAWFLLQQKVIGPSVDLDAMEYSPLGDPAELASNPHPEIEVTKGRISSTTLVQIPAFAEARPFALSEMDATEYAGLTEVTASGVARMAALPVAEDGVWDVLEYVLADEDEQAAGALYASGDVRLFPVARPVNGELRLIPAAVADAVSVLAFHGDKVQLEEGVKQAMRAELETLTAACGLPNPPWAQEALVASAGLRAAPRAHFQDPGLSGPTPLTITPEGRVYGHLATWGTCHIGFPGTCVTPPRSATNYARFHLGTVQTDEGPIRAGKITLGGGHADTRLGFQAAAEHYDDAGACVADVVAGEDKHGIWVSGQVRYGVTPDRLAELAASPLSGDWRKFNGNLELVAALAVNTPGFPVPHARAEGKDAYALVAAGVVQQPRSDEQDVRAMVAAALRRDRQLRATVQVFEDGLAELDRAARREAALAASRAFV